MVCAPVALMGGKLQSHPKADTVSPRDAVVPASRGTELPGIPPLLGGSDAREPMWNAPAGRPRFSRHMILYRPHLMVIHKENSVSSLARLHNISEETIRVGTRQVGPVSKDQRRDKNHVMRQLRGSGGMSSSLSVSETTNRCLGCNII